MADKAEQSAFDPFEAWRSMRDAGMDAWAKAMVQTVNSEAYTQTTGALLDQYLTASAPFRDLMGKITTEALRQFNLPSREEVAGVAQRLTNIELRLDDLDAKLDSLFERLAARAPAPRKAARKRAGKKKVK